MPASSSSDLKIEPEPGHTLRPGVLMGLALLLAIAGCGGMTIAPPTSSPTAAARPPVVATSLVQPTATPAPPAPTSAGSAPTAAPVAPTATPGAALVPPIGPSSTAVLTPTPRPRPTVTPPAPATRTPTRSPDYPVAQVFGKVIRDYPGAFMGLVRHNYPGAPLEPARQTKLSEQAFGSYGDGFCGSKDSLFLWREDTRQIYFLLVGNVGLHMEQCRDFWEVFPDTWQPGDPNNEDLKAPEGAVLPRGGIGKVWRQRFYGRVPSSLGFPKAPERYVVGTVQRFEHATAFYLPDTSAVYVLFDRFEYVSRSGTDTRPVWFEVK